MLHWWNIRTLTTTLTAGIIGLCLSDDLIQSVDMASPELMALLGQILESVSAETSE